MEKSIDEEIADTSMSRPHVVMLGAGASRAAFPGGDRNGKKLPLMNDFLEIQEFKEVIESNGVSINGNNFELWYSELANDSSKDTVRNNIERTIYNYFSSLSLPTVPTIYDYLILSLRPKDVIATFNWDPFLIQAAIRNNRLGGVPKLLFLHGNVLSGYCERDNVHGAIGASCSRCKTKFSPTKLLYPVAVKNYNESPSINNAWEEMKRALKNAFMVTIFGYSAPVSDEGAIKMLNNAWGEIESRDMEQIEIIDIRDHEELIDSWKPFIHTHHYEIHSNFFESWVSNHPRRTGEAYFSQYFEAKFIDNNSVLQTVDMRELWTWYEPLIHAEKATIGSRK